MLHQQTFGRAVHLAQMVSVGASSKAPTKDWQNTIEFVQGQKVLQCDARASDPRHFEQ